MGQSRRSAREREKETAQVGDEAVPGHETDNMVGRTSRSYTVIWSGCVSVTSATCCLSCLVLYLLPPKEGEEVSSTVFSFARPPQAYDACPHAYS